MVVRDAALPDYHSSSTPKPFGPALVLDSWGCPDLMYEYLAHVRSVYDGDTIRADIDCGFGIWTANQSLRLIGIDAPELGKPGGIEARNYLRGLLPVGQEMVVRTHKDADDKYGRLLAEVYLGDLYVNGQMVVSDHAVPYDGGAR